MPLNVIVNESSQTTKTVGIEGDGWKRVIIIVDPDDALDIKYLNNDPNQLLIIRKPKTT